MVRFVIMSPLLEPIGGQHDLHDRRHLQETGLGENGLGETGLGENGLGETGGNGGLPWPQLRPDLVLIARKERKERKRRKAENSSHAVDSSRSGRAWNNDDDDHNEAHSENSDSTHLVYDPIRDRYHAIPRLTYLCLRHWHWGEPEKIAHHVGAQTGTSINPSFVRNVALFLVRAGLCKHDQLLARYTPQRPKWEHPLTKLLHVYLFIRIPLGNPDLLLRRWRWWIEAVVATTHWMITIAVGLALWLIWLKRDEWWQGVAGMATWNQLPTLVIPMLGLKILHEIGHMMVASAYGMRVREVGVAFIMMWPVLYCDLNDAWRYGTRERLASNAAGLLMELLVASCATIAWALLSDGSLRSALLVWSVAGWITSVSLNLNPLIRFDGYFLLSDFLRIPNMMPRGLAMLVWAVRRVVWGARPLQTPDGRRPFPLPDPEGWHLAWLLIPYGAAVALWRVLLFGGIAILLATTLPKPLGYVLGGIEVGWFLVLPVWRELITWQRTWKNLHITARWRVWILFSLIVIILVVPWPRTLTLPARIQPLETLAVVVPHAARAQTLPQNRAYQKGEILLALESPQLENDLQAAELELQRQEMRMVVGGGLRHVLDRAAMAEVMARIEGLQRIKTQLVVVAPFDGIFVVTEPHVKTQEWLETGLQLGVLVNPNHYRIEAFATPDDARALTERLSEGLHDTPPSDSIPATFYPHDTFQQAFVVRLTKVATQGEALVPHPSMAATFGGSIAVASAEASVSAATSWAQEPWQRARYPLHRVTIIPNHVSQDKVSQDQAIAFPASTEPPQTPQTPSLHEPQLNVNVLYEQLGRVVVAHSPKSLIMRLLQRVWIVVVGEMSL